MKWSNSEKELRNSNKKVMKTVNIAGSHKLELRISEKTDLFSDSLWNVTFNIQNVSKFSLTFFSIGLRNKQSYFYIWITFVYIKYYTK